MRLRAGEIICLAAAVALFVFLSLNWTSDNASGWESLWVGTVLALGLAIVLAAVLVAVIVTRQTVAAQVVASIATVWTALIGLIALVVNTIGLAQDDALIGPTTLDWPAYAAIAAIAALFAGAWRSMSDERLTARSSAYEPPAPRSVRES